MDNARWPHRPVPSDLPLVPVCDFDGEDWPCRAERVERQRVRDALAALHREVREASGG